MQGKYLLLGISLGLILNTTPVQSAENDDLVGTVLWSPVVWTQQTLTYFADVAKLPFGGDGNPQDNWNYAGDGDQFGFYQSFSNESDYRYSRYGIN